MNYCVVTGKIFGDIDSEFESEHTKATFNLKNQLYLPATNKVETNIIRCICYGNLAEYCYNELYDGCEIIVTGRVCNRTMVANNTKINRLYIQCSTVSKLEQEEYN